MTVRFYSGFSLKNEEYLFEDFIKRDDYTICGFSYGAIKALNVALEELRLGNRVDTLQLFSPAFFQSKKDKFRHLQLMSYKKNENLYMREFLKACFTPYEKKIVEFKDTSIYELKELLEYEWSLDELLKLEESGVKIEVYLGGRDKIIDISIARDFFLQVSTVTYIKDANHFLQIN